MLYECKSCPNAVTDNSKPCSCGSFYWLVNPCVECEKLFKEGEKFFLCNKCCVDRYEFDLSSGQMYDDWVNEGKIPEPSLDQIFESREEMMSWSE